MQFDAYVTLSDPEAWGEGRANGIGLLPKSRDAQPNKTEHKKSFVKVLNFDKALKNLIFLRLRENLCSFETLQL